MRLQDNACVLCAWEKTHQLSCTHIDLQHIPFHTRTRGTRTSRTHMQHIEIIMLAEALCLDKKRYREEVTQ